MRLWKDNNVGEEVKPQECLHAGVSNGKPPWNTTQQCPLDLSLCILDLTFILKYLSYRTLMFDQNSCTRMHRGALFIGSKNWRPFRLPRWTCKCRCPFGRTRLQTLPHLRTPPPQSVLGAVIFCPLSSDPWRRYSSMASALPQKAVTLHPEHIFNKHAIDYVVHGVPCHPSVFPLTHADSV